MKFPSVSAIQIGTWGLVKDLYQHLPWQLPQLLWRLDSPGSSQGFLQFHPSFPWSRGKTCAGFGGKTTKEFSKKCACLYRSSGDIEYTVDAVATVVFPPNVDN